MDKIVTVFANVGRHSRCGQILDLHTKAVLKYEIFFVIIDDIPVVGPEWSWKVRDLRRASANITETRCEKITLQIFAYVNACRVIAHTAKASVVKPLRPFLKPF
jgi:hypothetical protein